jgi:hypothetical protein
VGKEEITMAKVGIDQVDMGMARVEEEELNRIT